MPSPTTDILWWINSEVNKLSGHGLTRVHDILNAAQAELQRDLAKAHWLGKDDRYTAQVHRNALMQIQGALDKINKQVGPELASVLRSNGRVAGSMATDHLALEVEKFSSIFEGTVRPIALEAATVIAKGDKLLWPRYRTSASRYAGQVGDDIRRQLAIGLIRGENIDQMVTRLANHGGPRGLVFTRGKAGDPGARAEIISEGLFTRYRYWAERLVRTEVVNAYNEAALIGMDELEADDPGYFKRWDAAVDGRLCILCREFDDLVVPLHGKFPLDFDKPPRHPNCRCAVCVWRKEWDEADVKDSLTGHITKGKEPGTIESVPHKFDVQDHAPKRELSRSREPLPIRSRARRSPEEIQQAQQEQATRRAERVAARNLREEARAIRLQEQEQARSIRQEARDAREVQRGLEKAEREVNRQLREANKKLARVRPVPKPSNVARRKNRR